MSHQMPTEDDMPTMANRVPEVMATIEGMSQSSKEFFRRVLSEIIDFAQENQVSPRELAASLSQAIGTAALTEARWDPHDDATIRDFLEFAEVCLHVGAAHARISEGWTPPKEPDEREDVNGD